VGNVEEANDYMTNDKWIRPHFEDWSQEEIKELAAAGRAHGVDVRGSTYDAEQIEQSWYLETANRLILRAHKEKSLAEYVQEKEFEYHRRLPDLDVDNLDPKRLKVVKIDLPEEDWFQLTLENEIKSESQ
jgi:radical SAM superfamily enzyme YgiQ (UPF0313 family)